MTCHQRPLLASECPAVLVCALQRVRVYQATHANRYFEFTIPQVCQSQVFWTLVLTVFRKLWQVDYIQIRITL